MESASDSSSTDSESEGSNFSSSSQSYDDLSSSSHPYSFEFASAPSKKSNKPLNVLQKLYNREIGGTFSSQPKFPNVRLFDKIPKGNTVRLQDVLPESAISNGHICMGLSKCGQFLLTYTHTSDIDMNMLANVHKYRLHWWLFIPHLPSRKVAEVMLFGNQGVYCELLISLCQWPTDIKKLLIYGYCLHSGNCQGSHSHLTITTVPSLSKCLDCRKVAASYGDDDLAAVWDSCVQFSCLKHGLTIHSNFEVFSPFPKFDAAISMKRDGVVLINTGSFLHVLRTELENVGTLPITNNKKLDISTVQGVSSTLDSSNQTDIENEALFRNMLTEPLNRMGEFLETCNANNGTILTLDTALSNSNILTGLEDNVGEQLWLDMQTKDYTLTNSCTKVDEEALTDREMILRDFSDEIGIGQQIKRIRINQPGMVCSKRMKYEDNAEMSSSSLNSSFSDICDTDKGTNYCQGVSIESNQELNIICRLPDIVQPQELKNSLLLISTSDESELEESSQKKQRRSKGVIKLSSPSITPTKTPETVYEFTDDAPAECEKISSFRRRLLADKKYEFSEEGQDAENIVPYRIHRRRENSPRLRSPGVYLPVTPLANHRRGVDTNSAPRSPVMNLELPTEQDKIVLRPLNRNINAFPLLSPRETKPSVKKMPAVESKPITNEPQAANPVSDVKPAKFTFQYFRRYIEVDDELVSVITDIEDDDSNRAPAYQLALPMEVHGAGYVQLQMISNSKAEKLMAPGALVSQMSFDVELFCHDIANTMCEDEGKKFCFVNDYDIEIMDVCPFTGDVFVLVVMRILTTEKKCNKKQRIAEEREQYQGECTFKWNTESGIHSIVSTEPLTDATSFNNGGPYAQNEEIPWGPARELVLKLRKSQPPFQIYHPVRCISNELMFSELSYNSLVDLDNLIQLALIKLD